MSTTPVEPSSFAESVFSVQAASETTACGSVPAVLAEGDVRIAGGRRSGDRADDVGVDRQGTEPAVDEGRPLARPEIGERPGWRARAEHAVAGRAVHRRPGEIDRARAGRGGSEIADRSRRRGRRRGRRGVRGERAVHDLYLVEVRRARRQARVDERARRARAEGCVRPADRGCAKNAVGGRPAHGVPCERDLAPARRGGGETGRRGERGGDRRDVGRRRDVRAVARLDLVVVRLPRREPGVQCRGPRRRRDHREGSQRGLGAAEDDSTEAAPGTASQESATSAAPVACAVSPVGAATDAVADAGADGDELALPLTTSTS